MSALVWSPGITLEAMERQIVLRAFAFYHNNKAMTANSLGIAVRTLDAKLEKYRAEDEEKMEDDRERKKRDDEFLECQRFGTLRKAGDGSQAPAGVRVEPPAPASPQPAVPVPERSEVQAVPPQKAAAGGNRRSG